MAGLRPAVANDYFLDTACQVWLESQWHLVSSMHLELPKASEALLGYETDGRLVTKSA